MKTIKNYIVCILWIALVLGANIGFSQTSRNLALSGGPDKSNYSGFPMTGTFELSFNNVAGANPFTPTPLPGGSLQIVVTVPAGIEFGDVYVPPAGWTYTKTSAIEALLLQVGPVSSDPPASGVQFVIPLKITAGVDEGVWGAQIQRLKGNFQDPDPNNSSPEGLVSVASNALPVTLVSFDVKKEELTANLSWKTTAETNSDRFEVERSNNSKNWVVIGEMAAAGVSKGQLVYGFLDVLPMGGINYYRLKMIDKDATFAYSRIKTIDFPTNKISVYPNPVSDELTIDTNLSNLTTVRLYDTKGITVYDSGKKVSGKINVRNLVPGMYIVKVEHLDGTYNTHKVLVVRQ